MTTTHVYPIPALLYHKQNTNKLVLTMVRRHVFSLSAPMQPKKPTAKMTHPAVSSSTTGLMNAPPSSETLLSAWLIAQLPAAINRIPITCNYHIKTIILIINLFPYLFHTPASLIKCADAQVFSASNNSNNEKSARRDANTACWL